MEISEAEFERASERAAKRREAGPYAVAVEFDPGSPDDRRFAQ